VVRYFVSAHRWGEATGVEGDDGRRAAWDSARAIILGNRPPELGDSTLQWCARNLSLREQTAAHVLEVLVQDIVYQEEVGYNFLHTNCQHLVRQGSRSTCLYSGPRV
jgi:hypothetical protein